MPDQGQALAILVTGPDVGPVARTAAGIKPVGHTDYSWNYSLFNSYGAGVLVNDYSRGGAYVLAGTGGHAHGDNTGAAIFDFADGLWKLLEHSNGGPRYASNKSTYGFVSAETTGNPYWELNGTISLPDAVPCPVHPYQMLTVLPASLGGGRKGSVMYVTRMTMGETGMTSSGAVHALDLETGIWRRVTNSLHPRDTAVGRYESSVVYDAVRQRYWVFQRGLHGFRDWHYLRASDWTFQVTPQMTNWPDSALGDGARAWTLSNPSHPNGVIFVQGANGTLFAYDPETPSQGWVRLTVNGRLPSQFDKFEYFPPTGKLYHITQVGGRTLTRLTPPAGNLITGTWTVDAVSISISLPPLNGTGDPSGASGQYGFLVYVPALRRMAWIPGGSHPTYLLYPH